MLLQMPFLYLPPAQGWGWESMKHFQCVGAWMGVCVCVHFSCFYINIYVSFIYENIFTKYAEDVYAYENMSVKIFILILKKQMAAIANCSNIISMF